MPTQLVTMRGVYVQYWANGATMIFASDTNVNPLQRFRSGANPPRDLINEVLGKIADNCNSGTPIQLTIENGTFIVRSAGGLPGPAFALDAATINTRSILNEVGPEIETPTQIPNKPKAKPAPKKAVKKAPKKKVAKSNVKKKAAAPKKKKST